MTIKAINARNQFQGTLKHIKRGGVVSDVQVDIGHQALPGGYPVNPPFSLRVLPI